MANKSELTPRPIHPPDDALLRPNLPLFDHHRQRNSRCALLPQPATSLAVDRNLITPATSADISSRAPSQPPRRYRSSHRSTRINQNAVNGYAPCATRVELRTLRHTSRITTITNTFTAMAMFRLEVVQLSPGGMYFSPNFAIFTGSPFSIM